MGTRLYVDRNLKKFTDKKLNAVPVNLLTDVYLPLAKVSNNVYNTLTDNNGNYIYKTVDGKHTTEPVSILKSEEIFNEKILNIIGDINIDENIFIAKEVKNKLVKEKVNIYEKVKVTEENYMDFNIEDVLSKDVENLLEMSAFDSAVMYIIDDIVGGTYKNYYSYSVVLDSEDSVIFNISDLYVNDAIKLYNVPLDLDIFVNTKKLNLEELSIDNLGGIIIPLDAVDVNISIVNNTDAKHIITNPFFLYQ